jgi:phage internal scaffolding protein
MVKPKAGDTFLDHAGNFCTIRSNGTLRVQTLNDEPSRTIQSEKDSCDINLIVSRFKTTGVMTNIAKGMPQYGDYSEVIDYQSALNVVNAAEDAFMALPATVRKRFANDPGQMLSFLDDPANRDEAVKLGLVDLVQDSTISKPEKADSSSKEDV